MPSLQQLEHKLGVDIVRRIISENCICEPAHHQVANMKFSTDYPILLEALNQTSEMVMVLEDERPFSLTGLTDAREWMANLRLSGSYIDTPDLANLRGALKVAINVSDFFGAEDIPYEYLKKLSEGIADVRGIVRIIDKVLTDNGEVKDSASSALREIRVRMSTIQGRISSAMRRVLSRAVSEGIIEADAQPSLRDGRLVVPVAAMNKRRIAGIVHDESATGRTYFIEPAEVVELNNEQRELELEERREIIRILIELADSIRPHIPELSHTFDILYTFDFIHAKALFASKVGGAMPHVYDKSIIEWHDARHPVLKLTLEAKNRSVVPLNIDLTADTARILVISGPNAGGKSVALKTVGINQYLMQCGVLPVMEPNSRMGIFDNIFVDMGDDQSIEDDLSTYSSHLRNMKYILSHGTDRSLVLIDEFGAGTEPQIGGAIAQALLADFNAKGMWGVITTHYQNLKQMAQQTPGITNGSMVYDRQLMKPTFRMVMGTPGSSFAVEIALRTGLPKSIIEEAEKIVGSDFFNLDKYLLDINRDRRYWENKRADIKRREKHLEEVIARYEQNAEKLREQRRTIIDEAKTEADNIIARSNAAVERTIHEIRKGNADKEDIKEIRRRLNQERQDIANEILKENKELRKAPRPKKPKPQSSVKEVPTLAVGDNVLLDNQGQPGTILDINRNKASVSFGLMKMTVPLSRLTHTIRKPQISSLKPQTATVEASRERQLSFNTEIDVRGMRADEAIQAVTYFIDDAIQFNAGRIRILHGTGTGALRVAIRHYLSTLSGVKSYHDEDVRFGGAGITVVDL